MCRSWEIETYHPTGVAPAGAMSIVAPALEHGGVKDMELHLEDKVAVVTGAIKGIGLAITKALARDGARVVAGARTIDALSGVDRVTAVTLILVAADRAARLVRRALDDHGRVDVLVNNVGAVKMRLQGFLGTSDDEF